MSEEIENAAVNVPRAIFSTMVLNGSTGFGMVIALLFCLGDPVAVLVISRPKLRCASVLTALGISYWIPFYTNFLQRNRVSCWHIGDDCNCDRPCVVRRDRFPRNGFSNDLVLCPRPRPAVP